MHDVYSTDPAASVVVMDWDGELDPEDERVFEAKGELVDVRELSVDGSLEDMAATDCGQALALFDEAPAEPKATE